MIEGTVMGFWNFEFRSPQRKHRQSKLGILKSKRNSTVNDFRPDTLVGENFQEQRVSQAAVDEMDALHAVFERANGTGDFGPHALVDDTFLFEFLNLADFQG